MTLVVGPIEEYFFFNGLPYFRGGMVIYPLECYHLPSDYDSIHYIIFLSSNSRWRILIYFKLIVNCYLLLFKKLLNVFSILFP